MKPILHIENVSKKFTINSEAKPYLSIRDSISGIFTSARGKKEQFTALKNINLTIQQGETVGIIGKNGAGKSTLLKILSRITPPTSGKITCRGRLASLLEVGTGFHPELSGRENIYFNGSILGMKRHEINQNFNSIVEFSGIGKFIDTQLKHYSSGMQLRLAFAVAAFLENEILIIDEVLAVGDAEFQEKCLGKMNEVSKSGRTILFVSHNLGALQALCRKSILLENGEKTAEGKSSDVIQTYLNKIGSGIQVKDRKAVFGETGFSQISILELKDKAVVFEIIISTAQDTKAALDLRLTTLNASPAGFGSLGTFNPEKMILLKEGINRIRIALKTETIANGLYYVSMDLTEPDKRYYDRWEHCLLFEVSNSPESKNGRVLMQDWNYGVNRIELNLEI